VVVLAQERLKIRRGHMFGAWLGLAPFHEKAVRRASEHAENPYTVVALHAATVIVVGDIQTLVQSAFDAPAGSIELEPLHGVQTCGWSAGNQGDLFLFAPGSLPQNPCGLLGHGKADVFGLHGRSGDGPVFSAAFVLLAGARLRRSRLVQGENPLGER